MAAPVTTTEPGVETPETPFEKRVGHHPGLFALFFAEMWERFSYYGMRALLIYYMTKDFLDYSDERAYSVYGAYTALVYMTPFVGGMVADRLLGQRGAVIIGGSLMALGHLIMTIQNSTAFFVALALLICGNGFFKPNIGTILGRLYGGDRLAPKKDGAFTIFYMGVNLGAAIAPLVCVYVGETYGWHWGFGLATIGMMIGLAIFIAPTLVTQVMIGVGASLTAIGLIYIGTVQDVFVLAANIFVAVALVVAMGFSLWALSNGAVPAEIGQPKDRANFFRNVGLVLGVTALAVAVFAWLCENGDVAGKVLIVVGLAALGYILFEAVRVTKIERERLFVILIMAFFSMLFWAFFEQAGSSISLFTDRNVDRVTEAGHITDSQVGESVELVLNQEQVGYEIEGAILTLDRLDTMRAAAHEAGETEVRRTITITPAHVGMAINGSEVPAGMFQATNPIFILIFGLVFTALWTALAQRKIEPSTPVKFVFGLTQLGLGFGVLWLGAQYADGRGMVGMSWLVLAYLLHTTGELCLSPVGLSMVSKMAPARMVATMMGAWYLATAFSQYLASVIAALTGVSEEGGGEAGSIPLPIDTLGTYTDVFSKIAIASLVAAVLLLVLSPFIKKWMHEDVHGDGSDTAPKGSGSKSGLFDHAEAKTTSARSEGDVLTQIKRILDANLAATNKELAAVTSKLPAPPGCVLLMSPIWTPDGKGQAQRSVTLVPKGCAAYSDAAQDGALLKSTELRALVANAARTIDPLVAERVLAEISEIFEGDKDEAPRLGGGLRYEPGDRLVSLLLADAARCRALGATLPELKARYAGEATADLDAKLEAAREKEASEAISALGAE